MLLLFFWACLPYPKNTEVPTVTESECVPTSETDLCDGLDNDCDGTADEDGLISWYEDQDQDGFGAGEATVACTAPEGFISEKGDCDDTNERVNPNQTELCGNGLNDDCNDASEDGLQTYVDADGDGYGAELSDVCQEQSGVALTPGDCNDGAADIYPGATEECGNGIDENCAPGCHPSGANRASAAFGYLGYPKLGNYVMAAPDISGGGNYEFGVSDIDSSCNGSTILLIEGSTPYIEFPITTGHSVCGAAFVATGATPFSYSLAMADTANHQLMVFDATNRGAAPDPWLIGPFESGMPFFGDVTKALGDLSGDGVQELAVGTSRDPAGFQDSGSVYLFSGDVLGPGYDGASPDSAGFYIEGNEDMLYFGSAIESADLDDDGCEELIVGAPGNSMDSVGDVFIFNFHCNLRSLKSSDFTTRITAVDDLQHTGFGHAIAAGVMQTGEEIGVAISAPLADHNGQVFFYPRTLLQAGTLTTNDWSQRFESPDIQKNFGSALAAADLDGDQYDELYISNSNPSGNPSALATVFGYFGPAPDFATGGSMSLTTAEPNSTYFGSCIVPLPNSDGRDRLLFCNYGADTMIYEDPYDD